MERLPASDEKRQESDIISSTKHAELFNIAHSRKAHLVGGETEFHTQLKGTAWWANEVGSMASPCLLLMAWGRCLAQR
jgi:hypothetical protein